MLVLTRKNRQSIMIGDDVEVTVLSSDGAKVRLGISAPADVPVHRSEIYLEIKSQNAQSASGEQRQRARRRQAR
jgi:carbon storage regulator